MSALIRLRRQLGLSQAQLGKLLGVGQSAVSQYEKGRCLMSPELALRLVQVAAQNGIATTLDQLYSRENRNEVIS